MKNKLSYIAALLTLISSTQSFAANPEYIFVDESPKMRMEFDCTLIGPPCYTKGPGDIRVLTLMGFPIGEDAGKQGASGVVQVSCKDKTFKLLPRPNFEKPQPGTLFASVIKKACSLK